MSTTPRGPRQTLGTAPILVPSPRIPTTGRVLGVSNAPGLEERQIAQPVIGGLSHSLIVGGTGTGKSTTLAHLLKQDAEAGRGALVIDMKGDLVSDLLALIPAKRHKDVIVLDPAAGGPVPGLKLFGAGRDPEITADVVLGVIRSISSTTSSWGPWSAKWLRAGLVTIAQDKTAALADLPFLFTDDAYRARLVGRLRDPMLRATWAAYDAMSEAERQHQLAAPLGRVEEIVGRRLVRGVLGQQQPKLDLGEVLRRGRIVLVSLNPGVLGGPAARLLGALVVHALFQAVLARVALAPDQRRPFFAYLDEVKLLADLATPLPELFEMARGQGVGVVAAPQSLAQLPDELRRAALSNAGSLLAFRQNFDDSVLLARELPGVDAEGLQHLGRYEVAARLTLAPGDVAPTATGRTLPPPEALSDPDEVRRLSAERYGVDPEETDRALRERHGLDDLKSASAGSAGDGADESVGWQRRRAS